MADLYGWFNPTQPRNAPEYYYTVPGSANSVLHRRRSRTQYCRSMEHQHIQYFASKELFELVNELLDSSDDEHIQRGGSRQGRSVNIERNHTDGARCLFNDYFSDNPVYNSIMFKRRYRLSRETFTRLFTTAQEQNTYLTQQTDCTVKLGLNGLQRAAAAMRLLA